MFKHLFLHFLYAAQGILQCFRSYRKGADALDIALRCLLKPRIFSLNLGYETVHTLFYYRGVLFCKRMHNLF